MLRVRLDDHAADGTADLDKASTAGHEAASQYLPRHSAGSSQCGK
jgi:hypothetical protein